MRFYKNKGFIIYASALIVFILPLILSFYIEDFNWSLFDFLWAGILIFGLAFALHFILKITANRKTKMLLLLGCFLFFVLLWLELAVGVFGSPIAGH